MLRDALWQRKLKRLRALAEIDLQITRNERAKKERIQAKVEADMEIRRKNKKIADIKFKLSQIKGEAQKLEEELERLDKGKQKEVVTTPELPKEGITAPQKEALEKESFHQNTKEDQSKEMSGPTKQEGEVDKKWLEEVEKIDDYLITRLQGTVPSALLLHLMKERLTRLGIHPENECLFSEAIERPEVKWSSPLTLDMGKSTYIPSV